MVADHSEELVARVSDRLSTVLSEIESYCDELGRSCPTLVAVSKTRPPEYITAAYDCGHRDFGENYAQELVYKARQLDMPVRWHFIGHLQRRNVPAVSSVADVVHAVDSTRVLDRLKRVGYSSPVMIQVNISEELSKSGVPPEEVGDLVQHGRDIGLDVRGLMTIGTVSWTEEEQFEAFSWVARMVSDLSLDYLSAGMSGDWRSAVRAGSTHVRIGTAIFGSRE